MKSRANVIIGIILFIALVATYFVIATDSNEPKDQSKLTNHDHFSHTLPDACAVFSMADAQFILGESVQRQADDKSGSAENAKVTNCSYVVAQNSRMIAIEVRAPLTDVGIETNEAVFGKNKPSDAQDVDGYGSDAFWDPEKGELNILREHSLITIAVGESLPAKRTLTDARSVADKVMVNIK